MYKLNVNLPDKNYDIIIKKGLIKDIGDHVKSVYKNKKIAVITDSNVEKIYGQTLKNNLEKSGFDVHFIVVKAGETSKSISVLEDVYDKLLSMNITRGDMIITFGGGVVGDLGGFAASTLLRGIKFIQVPTSLLAQIDSSVGGKVAVNLPKGKNLVGSFYHPEAVFIDPDLLKTLDKRFVADGMAEVIKYGCIRDRELFDRLDNYGSWENLFENIEEVIHDCCDIKRAVVEEDELDLGVRMILNFGHTLGHVIENFGNYEGHTHGEAVAIGMHQITKISEKLGLTEAGSTEQIKNILVKYNLPFEMPDIPKEETLKTINLDKKSNVDKISLVLISKIGHAFLEKIDRDDIFDYI